MGISKSNRLKTEIYFTNLRSRTRKDYLDIVMALMKDGGPLSFEQVISNSTFMYVAGENYLH